MSSQILLITDMAGYGKVALSAMLPILSHMGHSIYNLPTALVSNTFNYGKFEVLDTTGYMENTLRIWHELGFRFDAVFTGFTASRAQADLVRGFCAEQSGLGAKVFTDPIMADQGSLYLGLTGQTVGYLRELVAGADVTVPNYTEACLLTDTPYRRESLTRSEALDLVGRVCSLGAKSVVITSALVDGLPQVAGYDAASGGSFLIPYEEIPVFFPGTGDMFSSVLMGRMMEGRGLEDATRAAMNVVHDLVAINRGNPDKFRGVQVESSLEVIDRY
ncbi:bifunctional hydroxymethylpyrimidine kinase/phosphomethylpyrimidine kinase [Mesosutterella sp. OilRF-GAM-744-9]|uniref:pyridoxal kinase n=1 Tax=Mesosutterella porci TaxID=2915351 RepID=A0ABS9MMX1_9BURK|nr:bifunctional hydroxymethylpyrimidine kinase/phosphomethylpyrimidine kinase [Mesosutterella sp. oilRF-744-WT-GAM-9]MCG5029971.1 bifunctional hydroxymethylpyrimidine kinase/phosphomethylpyrimidine kinase [Mesosutterella sp. oilRF-744-WT-GAM-9]